MGSLRSQLAQPRLGSSEMPQVVANLESVHPSQLPIVSNQPNIIQRQTVQPVSTYSPDLELIAGIQGDYRDEPAHYPGGDWRELEQRQDGHHQRQNCGASDC
jgi:hypothetical protein